MQSIKNEGKINFPIDMMLSFVAKQENEVENMLHTQKTDSILNIEGYMYRVRGGHGL